MSSQRLFAALEDGATSPGRRVAIKQPARFRGEWEVRRLGELGAFRKGKGIRRTELRDTGFPCVRYGELYTRYENYVTHPVSRIPMDVAATALQIERDELLFAGSGETAEEIGICVAYIGEEPAYAGGDIIVLRVSREDPVYLAHLLNAPVAARQKARMAQGDAVVHIRSDHLAEVEFSLPPLSEQRAIAAVLMDVDALIGSLEALIAKKRAIKRAAMQQLLTGRTRLPGFEGEWGTRRLGEVAAMASGGTPLTSVGAYYNGDIPWVSINDMTSSGDKVVITTERTLSRLGLDNSSARLFPAGTVLYAMYASIGECSIAGRPLCASQAILGIQPGSSLRSAFLYYSLTWMKRRVKTLGQQGTQANLNKEMVQGLFLSLPPLPEQGAIAAVFTDMDAEIAALDRRLDKTRAIKQGMMQQLLTGAIRLPIPDAVAEDELSR